VAATLSADHGEDQSFRDDRHSDRDRRRKKTALSFVFREGMAMALIGILFGLAGAIAQTRLIGALLFGVSATDP
jgi:hypothetical protein